MMYLDNDEVIGDSLDKNGDSNSDQIEFLKQLVEPGDIVFDVGAYIGTITIPLAKKVGPTGYVAAFEPQLLPFHMLCGNIAMNELRNVLAFNSAVSEASGANMSVPPCNYSEQRDFSRAILTPSLSGHLVKTVALDFLTGALAKSKPKLIKINVNGMESLVLNGAKNLISDCKPLLHVTHGFKPNVGILKLLESFGYKSKILTTGVELESMICYHKSQGDVSWKAKELNKQN